MTDRLCAAHPGTTICTDIYATAFGYSPHETDQSLVPEFTVQYPVGISTKDLLHYLQLVNSSEFQQNLIIIINYPKYIETILQSPLSQSSTIFFKLLLYYFTRQLVICHGQQISIIF